MNGPCTRRFESGQIHHKEQANRERIATPVCALARNDRKEADAMAAEICYNSNSGLRWFHFRGPCGSTISIKGTLESRARQEAADRLRCDEDELTCTGWEPYYKRFAM